MLPVIGLWIQMVDRRPAAHTESGGTACRYPSGMIILRERCLMGKRKKSKSRSRQLPIGHVRFARAPFVSVIIPTYNSAEFLGQAIDSVLEQTFLDFEIIIVDDGSTDRTPEVAAQYSDHITYIRQPNGGNAAARNRGLAEARGRWLCFLDADDLWEPRKLERQLLDLLRHPEWMISFVRGIQNRTQ